MWHVTQLKGLPGTGPSPQQFSATGSGMHREGVVFEFVSDSGESWVGNFQSGLFGETNASQEIQFDERFVLVFASGQGYLINPNNRQIEKYIGGAVISIHRMKNEDVIVLNHQGIKFEAVSSSGTLWRTKRLSWDGFREVRFDADTISGEGWDASGDVWSSFVVNLSNGQSSGGAYHFESKEL